MPMAGMGMPLFQIHIKKRAPPNSARSGRKIRLLWIDIHRVIVPWRHHNASTQHRGRQNEARNAK
jgi:hypothetical protein